ncbi:MAG: folylpolyglutamate synthase/dihydrofolate synthase family protein [Balneolales bacterium]
MSIKKRPLTFDSVTDVHNWLNTLPAFQLAGMKAANMSLEQITHFCTAMDSPHQKIKTIHVAGTNGKGGTCAILSAVYSAAGYKTGLFTSPHLVSLHERFRIDGRAITDDDLLAFFREHQDLLERFPLTYFEITVAIAFWWFHKEQVDISIIETGLGGRLDATNIIRPLLSVITTISLDHTNYLGHTLQAISREKAGIIKPGIPVITGNVSGVSFHTIKEEAKKLGSEVIATAELSPAYNQRKSTYSIRIAGDELEFKSDLQAPVQCHNIAVAWQAVRQLDKTFKVAVQDFKNGLLSAGQILPGRFEKLMSDRLWYFDGAHNAQALQALKKSINTLRPESDATVVFAFMKDKIDENMPNEFSGFKKNYYYTLQSQRAATYDDICRTGFSAVPLPHDKGSIIALLDTLKSELVIFTGSFYFYTTVKDWLDHFHVHKN